MRDSYRGVFLKPNEQMINRAIPLVQTPKDNENSNLKSEKKGNAIEVKKSENELPNLQNLQIEQIKGVKASNLSRSQSSIENQRKRAMSPAIRSKKPRVNSSIKKLNQSTRWMPNSAFTTYFGKPAFENYGQGNIKPTYGGLMYGDYLKTHNIAPHEGQNNPEYSQVYGTAEKKALQKKPRSPEPPRKCKNEDSLTSVHVEELKQRCNILGETRTLPSKQIVKPDLINTKQFKSEQNTPEISISKINQEEKKIIQTSVMDSARTQGSKLEIPNPEVIEANFENKSVDNNENKDFNQINAKSLAGDSCNECEKLNPGKPKMISSYQDMTSRVFIANRQVVKEPFKYCAHCLVNLYPNNSDVKPENLMKPPHCLSEIPFEELNPKNYKTLPPQWTQRIPAAGKLSYKSPSAFEIMYKNE